MVERCTLELKFYCSTDFSGEFLQVGQAGKRLFKFFEDRWEEVAPTSD